MQPPPKPHQIGFADLVAGRDRILWGYFGLCQEYHTIMDWVKSAIPLSVTIAKTKSEFESSGEDWLDKREFKTSPVKPHSIDEYLSGLDLSSIKPILLKRYTVGLIVRHAPHPGGDLTDQQIRSAGEFLKRHGLTPIVSDQLTDEVGAVAGVESPCIWKAARLGLPVAMPERSVGYELAKKIAHVFPLK